MNEQTLYEQKYQIWIQKHLRTILITAFTFVLFSALIEMKAHIERKQQSQAQELFEQYLDNHNPKSISYLIVKYPKRIQTHLALFSEAKIAYDSHDLDTAIEHLEFIRTHSLDEGILKIASYRLAHIYTQQQAPAKAYQVLSSLDDDAHTQLELALTIEDPEKRAAALDKALALSDSPYLNNMIAITQNDMIKP